MIWQPIETAPKDGTTVLLYVQKDGCPHECSVFVAKWTLLMTQYRQDSRVHQLMGWQIPPYGDLDAEFMPPTHWMPLPRAPGLQIVTTQ